MFKKFISIIVVGTILLSFSGCGKGEQKNENKISIVATLFPQYDFAREIIGDKGNVALLLPPGVESHTYEPSPSDIIKINNSDLFIYTGKYMESWAESIINGITKESVLVLDASKNIDLKNNVEEHHEGESEEEHEAHQHDFDPHIWTNPLMAKKMVQNILEAVVQIDSENKKYYEENAANYQKKLDELHEEFTLVTQNAKRKTILFGGRFALYYLAEQYDIEYMAAFDNCSTETEPSVKVVSEMISKIKAENIPVIYYEELTDPKVARSISKEAGIQMLLLHSCHNLSKEELTNGEGYYSLMKKNIENLRIGLN